MREQKFRKLSIWHKAVGLIEDIYKITNSFPKDELYGLTNQLRRAAVSIAMNIAEGSGADSDMEFKRFLIIAFRSTYEVMCGIEVAIKLNYITDKEGNKILDKLEELSAMINGFTKKLKADS
ncbi:MAG: hypothetical protein CO035_06590 [Candidatus Omnitrophica bacterium CG_4_9_14_0_2_um_filter_42_8]|nr:MAG: hypothetical protein CO035_06590 [Candidatus Omnitrophica bacterium CG_4_9_14_0_2_um_filter_42_8]